MPFECGVMCYASGSIDCFNEFQGESDDEALHRDSVTKAGAASALSVGSMTTDVIDQWLVS